MQSIRYVQHDKAHIGIHADIVVVLVFDSGGGGGDSRGDSGGGISGE